MPPTTRWVSVSLAASIVLFNAVAAMSQQGLDAKAPIQPGAYTSTDGKAPPMLPNSPGRGYLSHPAIRGDRLVFVADQDLWTTTLNGDGTLEASRLTSGAGGESWPVISPDGKTLAFAADYDGNPEIYAMPTQGGSPKRLTFHNSSEQPLAFTPDSQSIIYRSGRANPLGRKELWQVPVNGGPAKPLNLGEASLVSIDASTGRSVFTRWSNEEWHWKGYRGGTAPDLWLASADGRTFSQLSKTPENELFPMWMGGRVWYLSDATGSMNLWSMDDQGNARSQHTFFTSADLEPRWASADGAVDGRLIVFARGGEIIAFDTVDGSMRTLDIRLIGDRLQSRPRLESIMENASGFTLSPGGKKLAIESRGEVVVVAVDPLNGDAFTTPIQLPLRSQSRERSVAWIDGNRIAYISDINGQSDIYIRSLVGGLEQEGSQDTQARQETGNSSVAAADPMSLEETKVESSEVWMYPLAGSLDGNLVAWSTKSGFLRVLDVQSRTSVEVDSSTNGAITDYRFSPDSKYLAWSRPLSNGLHQIVIRNLASGVNTVIGDGMTSDYSPRWDPANLYLYFLSDRHFNPTPDHAELNFANLRMTNVCVVPLHAKLPPPLRKEAAQYGMDLTAWQSIGELLREPRDISSEESVEPPIEQSNQPKVPPSVPSAKSQETETETAMKERELAREQAKLARDIPLEMDTEGISDRVCVLPIQPGDFDGFEAVAGGVLLGRRPLDGVLDEEWPEPPLGQGGIKVEHFDLVKEKNAPLLPNEVDGWTMDPTGSVVVAWDGKDLLRIDADGGDPETIDIKGLTVPVNPREEWSQMFEEAWRLQRDFFWREDMNGVDWAGMRDRYRPLVERVGSRAELNDVIGELMSELRNSHAYVSGGDDFSETEPVSVGSLGVDLVQAQDGWKIARILPDFSAIGGGENPLAKPFRNVKAGQYLVSIDGVKLDPSRDPAELLVGKGGKDVMVLIADTAGGEGANRFEITLPSSDHKLRYFDWVERNRKLVDKVSGGKIAYIHLSDMDSDGLISFMRTFYPQTDRQGLLVDIRDNGGGYISSLLVEKLSRKPWAYTVPREGRIEPYPTRVIDGPIVVLMDQGAGSDGDIFPESMRSVNGTTLVGTRTWGGVVGIDGDKSFMDGGMSTQPSYGFWTPKRGYKVENEGVAPDIELEWLPQDQQAGHDTQLERALDILKQQMPQGRELPARIQK